LYLADVSNVCKSKVRLSTDFSITNLSMYVQAVFSELVSDGVSDEYRNKIFLMQRQYCKK